MHQHDYFSFKSWRKEKGNQPGQVAAAVIGIEAFSQGLPYMGGMAAGNGGKLA
ncbi:MAG: hypothetical protein ABIW38_00145 [Ferruginibacter sp.]